MNKENRQAFFNFAVRNPQREACALLIVQEGIEALHFCVNVAAHNNQFEITPSEYIKATKRGQIIGVVHSHCYESPEPSEADKVACETFGWPYYIVSVPTGLWAEYRPSGYRAPLVGRQWAHGVLDCYALIRDYYARECAIILPSFEYAYEWWKSGENLYAENFERAGFHEVPLHELQPHDGILMQIHSPVINHAGIYLGDDLVLHHMTRRLSSRDVYSGYLKKHSVKAVRFGAK